MPSYSNAEKIVGTVIALLMAALAVYTVVAFSSGRNEPPKAEGGEVIIELIERELMQTHMTATVNIITIGSLAG